MEQTIAYILVVIFLLVMGSVVIYISCQDDKPHTKNVMFFNDHMKLMNASLDLRTKLLDTRNEILESRIELMKTNKKMHEDFERIEQKIKEYKQSPHR